MRQRNISWKIRLTSMSMAFFMLFSSIGISLEFHFCGHELKSIGLFTEANQCEVQTATSEFCFDDYCCNESKLEKADCCENTNFFGQLDVSTTEYVPISSESIGVFEVMPIGANENIRCIQEGNNYLRHPIPIGNEDILIANQVFII